MQTEGKVAMAVFDEVKGPAARTSRWEKKNAFSYLILAHRLFSVARVGKATSKQVVMSLRTNVLYDVEPC